MTECFCRMKVFASRLTYPLNEVNTSKHRRLRTISGVVWKLSNEISVCFPEDFCIFFGFDRRKNAKEVNTSKHRRLRTISGVVWKLSNEISVCFPEDFCIFFGFDRREKNAQKRPQVARTSDTIWYNSYVSDTSALYCRYGGEKCFGVDFFATTLYVVLRLAGWAYIPQNATPVRGWYEPRAANPRALARG